MKDTVFGKVKSVKEELVFLNKNKQNYRLFSSDGDYGHSGFMNNVATKSRFYNNWYHTAFVHYLNYYKEFDEKGRATNEIWYYKNGDTVRRYEYQYNDKAKLVQIKELYGFDDSFKITSYNYNEYTGNLLSNINYYSDEPESYRYTYYVYDRKMNNVLIEVNNFNNEGVTGGSKFIYDEQGKKIKKINKDYYVYNYYNDGSSSYYLGHLSKDKLQEEYFYNQDGNLEEVWQYRNKPKDENQVELSSKTKKYYSKKGLLEYSIITSVDDTVSNLIGYKYDNKDRIIEEIYVHRRFILDKVDMFFEKESLKIGDLKLPKEDLIISRKLNYKFNQNNLIELKEIDTFGEIIDTTCKFEYTFDDKNNWTEQVKYINGEKLYVWKRKINYYK
jgi:hypothetical protein